MLALPAAHACTFKHKQARTQRHHHARAGLRSELHDGYLKRSSMIVSTPQIGVRLIHNHFFSLHVFVRFRACSPQLAVSRFTAAEMPSFALQHSCGTPIHFDNNACLRKVLHQGPAPRNYVVAAAPVVRRARFLCATGSHDEGVLSIKAQHSHCVLLTEAPSVLLGWRVFDCACVRRMWRARSGVRRSGHRAGFARATRHSAASSRRRPAHWRQRARARTVTSAWSARAPRSPWARRISWTSWLSVATGMRWESGSFLPERSDVYHSAGARCGRAAEFALVALVGVQATALQWPSVLTLSILAVFSPRSTIFQMLLSMLLFSLRATPYTTTYKV